MGRFNATMVTPIVENLAGGKAYQEKADLEFVSLLLTSFAKDKFYEKADASFERLKQLIPKLPTKFVAKAAVYARTKFGMRSISHVVASELAKYLGGATWASDFYNAIVYRPDDMMEILAYHQGRNGKIPNAMKRGFAWAFDKFDAYSLAKYRGEGKGFKLVDVVNLVHPKRNEKNAEAIEQLVKGTLRSFDTWETNVSAAGADKTKKTAAWTGLIDARKIGYFALLKNLRNIVQDAPEALQAALDMLVNPNLIQKSLVLPFRYSMAYDEIEKLDNAGTRNVLVYLNKAIDIAVQNVPKFDGQTLVVLDVSGSMTDDPKVEKIARLFTSVLLKANNCDFMTFDGGARYVQYNPMDSTMTLAKGVDFTGGSTDFRAIFTRANKAYDRIIILSDMQGWVGYQTPVEIFNQWKAAYKADPFIYSFDLAGHGTLQFPQNKVYCLAGFSEKTFDIMKLLEKDQNAMINEINSLEF